MPPLPLLAPPAPPGVVFGGAGVGVGAGAGMGVTCAGMLVIGAGGFGCGPTDAGGVAFPLAPTGSPLPLQPTKATLPTSVGASRVRLTDDLSRPTPRSRFGPLPARAAGHPNPQTRNALRARNDTPPPPRCSAAGTARPNRRHLW